LVFCAVRQTSIENGKNFHRFVSVLIPHFPYKWICERAAYVKALAITDVRVLGGIKVKLCKKCNRPVDYSVCAVVSTNRISPRFQKCSESIALCQGCFDSFVITGDAVISESIRASIRPAFTELGRQVESAFKSQSGK
jgi:hypothetical protein